MSQGLALGFNTFSNPVFFRTSDLLYKLADGKKSLILKEPKYLSNLKKNTAPPLLKNIAKIPYPQHFTLNISKSK
jgi:hypothetical protein